ncbi:MAG: phenylalanine--tRNA ligase subunit alpha [Streptococcus salivarius]
MDLQTQLQELKTSTQAKLAEMRGEHSKELQELRVAVLGKKGSLTDLLKGLKDLLMKNALKLVKWSTKFVTFDEAFDEAAKIVEAAKIQAQLDSESLYVTLPGRQVKLGNRHILSQTAEEIEDIFLGMGFQIVDGFEVETDYYNFERMNLPKDHPARDMQDTFYITEEILLRTHTSPVQARTLDKHDFSKGPLKMISPGRVFRRDTDDATHSHQFHQIEGLVVGKNISMGDLKGTLEMIIQKMFGAERQIRLRPSYFPFTEPSVEVDVSCFKCGGKGCNVCKKTGWIEILGAGMVHPQVLEMSGVDSEEYSGFAFGLGQERIAMLRYGINDIRGFYQGDVRFSEQFK